MALFACLPPTLVDGNWQRTAAPARFDTPAELSQAIGAGQPSFQGGWVSSAHASYERGGELVDVTVYDLGSPASAQALLSRGDTAITSAGAPSVFFDSSIDEYLGVAVSGQYVFLVVGGRAFGQDVGAFLQAIAQSCG